MYFLKIVLLNTTRDWRRNIVNMLAVSIGTLVLLLFGGFVESMYDGLRENTIHSQLGHIQVSIKEEGSAVKNGIIGSDLSNQASILAAKTAGVLVVSKRLEISGLVSFGDRALPVQSIGVEPDADAEISSTISVVAGRSLFDTDLSGGLFGRELLELLGADVGDVVTLLAATKQGAINAVDIEVIGSIDTGISEINSFLIKTNIELMEELFDYEGVTELVLMVSATDKVPLLTDKIIDSLSVLPDQLIVTPWYELSDNYHQVVNLFDGIFGVIRVLVWVVVFATVFSSFLLTVYSRTPQLATFRAIGGSSFSCFYQVFIEGFLIAVSGALIGIVSAYFGEYILRVVEIPMPTPPGSTVTYPIRVILLYNSVAITAVLTALITCAAIIIPAYRASKVPIVQAMKS